MGLVSFSLWTVIALMVTALLVYLVARPVPRYEKPEKSMDSDGSVANAA